MKAIDIFEPVSRVDDLIITQRLATETGRPSDFEGEARVLSELAELLNKSPRVVLQKLSDAILELCRAKSSGITLLETSEDGDVLRWIATSGGFAPMVGGTMPVAASPCGTVIDRDQALMMSEPGRFYPAAQDLRPYINEIILAPFYVSGRPIGTVWGILHEDGDKFDAEDMRLLRSLSRFAGAAYTLADALKQSHDRESALEDKNAQRVVLARELTHRMKNLLSIVQAITAQSLRNARSVEEAQEAVMGRISALGRAQDILTQSDWVDTEIDQVISSILDLHDNRSGRFDVRGDRSVVLSDQQGLGLALALHELATNAIKYGALSNEAGRVTITWRASAGGEFSLDWVEHGGPPVVAPTRTGFGSRLIEKMVAPHFQGNASLHYPPEGARFQLSGRLGNE